MLNINEKQIVNKYAVLELGFRIFFIGAASFAFLSMLLWTGIYGFGWAIQPVYFAPMTWHAHEMIFGYGVAVIAGFLLTAVKNWTGIQTIQGYRLLIVFVLWAVARFLPFVAGATLEAIALIDNLFMLALIVAVAMPIIQAKNWRNIGIVAVLALLLSSNIAFYLGALELIQNGVHIGLYSGLYLIILLIFVMGRRVIPFFIERGVGYPIKLNNWQWIDKLSIVAFVVFWIADLASLPFITAWLATVLFVMHGIRLFGWHTHGIWKKPLLWVLYCAYALIVLGFALKAMSVFYGLSPYLAIHAFAFGGIGMMTLGMMSRVTLGHTGRSVLHPPKLLNATFILLLGGAVVRIIFPLLDNSLYMTWIFISQVLWMLSFGLFLYIYFPALMYPRIDGRSG